MGTAARIPRSVCHDEKRRAIAHLAQPGLPTVPARVLKSCASPHAVWATGDVALHGVHVE